LERRKTPRRSGTRRASHQVGEHGRVVGWQVVGDGEREAGVGLALRVERFEQPVARVGLGE
jgi:hypothetical protein